MYLNVGVSIFPLYIDFSIEIWKCKTLWDKIEKAHSALVGKLHEFNALLEV
jgi:hypothetical protein